MLKRLNIILEKFQKYYIILVILLASFLRLYRIADYMTFLGDEGRDVLVVKHILEGKLTLLGPTASVGGFFLGPIYYYFMAPFLWLFQMNPAGPAVMVALFGIATVGLIYKVGSEFFGKKAGMISAAIYAISPLVIAYSRASWNPNLMPFFSLLTLYIIYKAVKNNNLKLFFVSGILLGILMQLHYLATFLGAIIFTYVLYLKIFSFKKLPLFNSIKIVIKEYFYISVGFLIGLSPFLAFELRHGFPNSQSISNFIFHSKDVSGGSNVFIIIGDVFFRLFARLILKFPAPEQFPTVPNLNLTIWFVSAIVLLLLASFIFLSQYYRTFQFKKDNFLKFSLIFIWLFLGVCLFGLYKKPIYDYYFGFLFPLPFLLLGNALSYLLSKNMIFKSIAMLSLLVILAVNLTGIPFRFTPNKQLAQTEDISRFIFDKTGGKPFNFALITGGNSDHAYRYFFEVWGNTPITIENSQVDPNRKTVTDQLFVICESLPCSPLGVSLWEIAGFGRAEIEGEWDVSVVKIYKLNHYKEN